MAAPVPVQCQKFRTGTGASGTVTAFTTYSSGSLAVVGTVNFSTVPTNQTISDSVNGAYTVVSRTGTGSASSGMFYKANVASGSVDLSWASQANGIDVFGHEVTGADTTAPLITSNPATATATTLDTGSIDPTPNTDAIYFAVTSIDDSANPATVNINQTGTTGTWAEYNANSKETNGASFMVGDMVYLQVTATGNHNHVWSSPASHARSSVIAVFKAGAAAAQDTPELRGRPEGLRGQRQMHQLLAT